MSASDVNCSTWWSRDRPRYALLLPSVSTSSQPNTPRLPSTSSSPTLSSTNSQHFRIHSLSGHSLNVFVPTMYSVAHLSREPKNNFCETCDRSIPRKDWSAHAASKKHRENTEKKDAAVKKATYDKKNGGFFDDNAVKPASDSGGFTADGFVTDGAVDDGGQDGWTGNFDSFQGGSTGYDGDSAGQGCFKCGSTDHMKKDCPQGAGGGNGCFKCGSTDHMKKDCPQGSGVSCYNCGLAGHIARSCDQPKKPGAGPKCYGCNEIGRSSSWSISSCSLAHKIKGHVRSRCPNEQGGYDAGSGNAQGSWGTQDNVQAGSWDNDDDGSADTKQAHWDDDNAGEAQDSFGGGW
ncbi:unnamed protein product [Periconia digitata]|uniref:CCHC-type domain-containing protein n=1 Tax=Periconia digitata TaxID=1303443 RepID=A0A9W4UQL2_9PLEO|nr:unnamed protein product [Periconia digitata]